MKLPRSVQFETSAIFASRSENSWICPSCRINTLVWFMQRVWDYFCRIWWIFCHQGRCIQGVGTVQQRWWIYDWDYLERKLTISDATYINRTDPAPLLRYRCTRLHCNFWSETRAPVLGDRTRWVDLQFQDGWVNWTLVRKTEWYDTISMKTGNQRKIESYLVEIYVAFWIWIFRGFSSGKRSGYPASGYWKVRMWVES